MSGGKDSLTLLTLLAALREYVPYSYDLTAITIDMGLGGMDFSPVARLCERLGVPYSPRGDGDRADHLRAPEGK